jgi:hypothetical protein
MAPLWITRTQNKLRNTINKYNKNLAPLGLRVKRFGNPNYFEVVYGNGNQRSNIRVNTNPYLLSANLIGGGTYENNRGKGIGLALRTFAVAVLRNAGFVKVKHQGVTVQNRNNASRAKTGNVPISTYIVRKYLGFRPMGNASNHRSIWRDNSVRLAKLKNAEGLSRNKLKALIRN